MDLVNVHRLRATGADSYFTTEAVVLFLQQGPNTHQTSFGLHAVSAPDFIKNALARMGRDLNGSTALSPIRPSARATVPTPPTCHC